MRDGRRALEYLTGCSEPSTEAFRISHMNYSASQRRKMSTVVDHWVEAEVGVGFFRLSVQCRHPEAKMF